MKAWHFVRKDRRLGYGDGRLVVDGETLTHLGEVKLCAKGLHFSLSPLDALRYAPGAIACYVEVGPCPVLGDDKGVSNTRKVIKSVDATEVLIKFAILQALTVYKDEKFGQWAEKWLSGKDRTAYAANANANAAAAAGGNTRAVQAKLLEEMLFEAMGIKGDEE